MADSKLTPRLAPLVEWALRNPERRRPFEPLARGLLVKLYIDHSGMYHVLLARQGAKGPSEQECRTVLAHWPEPVPASVGWAAFERGQYQCCVAIWRPEKEAEQLALGETTDTTHA